MRLAFGNEPFLTSFLQPRERAKLAAPSGATSLQDRAGSRFQSSV